MKTASIMAALLLGALISPAPAEPAQNEPVLTTLFVSPPQVSMNAGTTQQFTVIGRDQFGNQMPVSSVTWSATGGTITQTGLYTVGSVAGRYTVTATSGAVVGTATVSTGAPILWTIVLSPASRTMQPGETAVFIANGTDQYGNNFATTYTWSASAGTIQVTGPQQCFYTAPSVQGTYTLTVSSSGRNASATITLAPPVFSTITVSPFTVNLNPGLTQQFTATARDQYGTVLSVPITWAATGGSITSSGFYTAPSVSGTFSVTATSGAIQGTATVNVAAGQLTTITVSPSTATLSPGGSRQFTATARDQFGTIMNVPISWTATGGTITSGGLYTASNVGGVFTVHAESGFIYGWANVTISTPPVPTTVTVTPTPVQLAPGASQQFTATVKDQYGVVMNVPVAWSANGGTVTSSGFYTAPLTVGMYIITASAGTVAGTAAAVIGQSTTIVNNGDPGKRIDFVFVPQGYSNAELGSTFVTDCVTAVAQLQNRSPFKEYFPYFNCHRVIASANEAPDVDVEVVLINAAGRSYATLGGTKTWVYRTQIVFALVHELGHCMNSMLQDEYIEPGQNQTYTGPEPVSGNMTISLSSPKWNHWIPAGTPRPTLPAYVFPPGVPRIGLFEGGMFAYTRGVYRPAYNCHMRTAGSTPFDEVCTEIIVRSNYTYPEISTYDTVSPPAGNVDAVGVSTTFTVVPKSPADHTLTILWSVDGTLRQSGGTSFTINTSEIVNAGTAVECEVKDITSRVRLDSAGVMTDRIAWTLRRAVSSIVVTPASALLPTNGTKQFTAVAYDPSMNPVPVTLTWTATGGTITQTGLYTAPASAGAFTVRASFGTISGTSTVTVQVPQLTSIVVIPASVHVAPGYPRRFTAEGRDQFGSPYSIGAVTWSASVGTIDSTGRYSAPGSTGTFTITARYSTLSGIATAKVHTSTMRGDMNGDGMLTATDLVLLQNFVFLGTGMPAYQENADCNDDKTYTSSDVVMELNAVFLGSPLPPVPPGGTPLDE